MKYSAWAFNKFKISCCILKHIQKKTFLISIFKINALILKSLLGSVSLY